MVNDIAVQEFVKAIKSEPTDPNNIYNATVSKIDNEGVVWVNIHGSDKEAPTASTSTEVKRGDAVTVNWRNNKLYIGGNYSNPSAGVNRVQNVETVTNELVQSNVVITNELQAESAKIVSLEADTAKVHDLTAEQLSATVGYIGDLTADSVTASDIAAATGYIGDLTAGNVTASNIVADHGTIGNLDTNYAQINLANVNNAWIQNGTIKDAAISNEMVNSISANKLTAGTIDASNIRVTNLNASNITTGSITVDGITIDVTNNEAVIDGGYIEDGTITMNGLAQSVQDAIDGAIETFTGTVVPTLNNSPASSWTTTALKDQHIGDVYYVVNSSSEQNGYCYRFTKSGNTYSWQLIKDSDVTAALARLQTAEGKIGDIETFDQTMATFKTDTEGEISTLQTKTTNLETSLGDKVSTSTFNELSQTVDGNSATITTLTTTVQNKADSSTVTTLSNTVNTVSQKADSNESKISNLTTLLQTNADGTTASTDIVHQVSALDQDLDSITTRVGKTEVQILGQYATSTTAQGTTAKVATITPAVTGWTLYTGATITVKFTNANTATTPTLNINSTGAKTIKTYSGGALSADEYKWKAGSTFTFTYNGTYWLMQDSTVATRMSSAESSITQNAENIELKVSKDGVISSINQSAETVKIQASKVEIDGTAIFNAISDDVDDAITDKGYQTASDVSTAIAGKADKTDALGSVTTKDQYYLSTSSSSATGGSWQDTVPTWAANKYIWTRVATTKTPVSGTATTTYSTAVYDSALTSALSTANSAQASANSAASTVVTTKQYYLSTSASSATGGSWGDSVPTWASGKYIWVRFKIVKTPVSGTATTSYTPSENGTYDSALTTALSTANTANTGLADKADKTDAIARSQRIYWRATSTSGKPGTNTTWLATSGTGYGNWSLSIPQLTSGTTKYPYLYTAVQTQTVSQQAAGNTCSCSAVLLDDTTTVIDGGTIITGTVNANAVNASSGTFDVANIPNLSADKITTGTISVGVLPDDALNSNIEIGGRNLLQNSKLRKSGSAGGVSFYGAAAGPEYIYISGTANEDVDQYIADLTGITLTNTTVTISSNAVFSSSTSYFYVSTTKNNAWYKNYEKITWYSSTERRLTITLEDGETLRYLRLKMASGDAIGGAYRFKVEVGNKQTDWTPANYVDSYVTDIDSQNGITIKALNGSTDTNTTTANYIKLNATGMNVYKGGVSVAEYGDTARIGASGASRVEISTNGMEIYGANDHGTWNCGTIGIGSTNTGSGTAYNPYYTFGYREGTIGAFSTTVGATPTASGYSSFAQGSSTASGYLSASLNAGTASGDYSIACGTGHATARNTFAGGSASHAQHAGSIVHGSYLQTSAENQAVFGKYNADNSSALFIIGKGTSISTANRSNAFVVLSTGSATLAGTLTQGSDRRLKEHISYLDDEAVEFIDGLKPAHYTKDGIKHVGFYAQDVAEVDKWDCMIGEEMNGYMTLGYTELLAPLVAYVQRLEKRIEELERSK